LIHIIHGTYRFKQRRIGVCKDFCNACEQEVLAEQWKSFNVWHLYFIPLIPLGWRKRWLCTNCHKDPHARYRTPKTLKKIGLGFLAVLCAFMTFGMWSIPVEGFTDGLWVVRLLFPLAVIACIYFGFFHHASDHTDVMNTQRRSQVEPLDVLTCTYCHQPLNLDPVPYCPWCDVRVYTAPPEN